MPCFGSARLGVAFRGIAQSGSASGLGPEGWWFKSIYPDQLFMKLRQFIEGQRKNRKSLSQTRRLGLWKQAHGRCWYCGCETPKTFFVLEHVQPFSRGGADSARNLVVSCWQCDRLKGSKTLDEFRAKRGGGEFYGEHKRPMRVVTAEEAAERRRRNRIQKAEKKAHWQQKTNPRMVRLGEHLPQSVTVRYLNGGHYNGHEYIPAEIGSIEVMV